MKLDLGDFWLGTQASLDAAIELEARADEQLKAGPFDQDPDENYLLQKVGKVGIVTIRGPLINSDNPILAYFGVSTYPAIRRAVVAAAKDFDIEQIVLNVASGGGAVSGVADTAALIRDVHTKVKPVTTFASGDMASAAYWLGVSAGKRYATKTSTVGSIGVLAVHIEYSKQMAQEGVKATVVRSGKFKALNNPYEPLTDVARAQMQEQIDAAYQVFGDHVAASLGMTFAEMDRKVGQGREFFGVKALDAGLIDGISSLDVVMTKVSTAKKVDRQAAVYDNGITGDTQVVKKPAVLTDADIAAIAAGAPLAAKPGEVTPEAQVAADAEKALLIAAEAALEGEEKAFYGKLAADKQPAFLKAKSEDRKASMKAVADEAAKTPAGASAAPANELVSYLQGELATAQTKITSQAIELKAATDKVASMGLTHDPLIEIARKSVANMRVALGGSADGLAALGATEVLAEHKRLGEEFTKKFKVGGVAAVSIEAPESKGQAVVADPSHQARIAATRS